MKDNATGGCRSGVEIQAFSLQSRCIGKVSQHLYKPSEVSLPASADTLNDFLSDL